MVKLLNWFKEYAKDFPTLGAGAIVGIAGISTMSVIVDVRLALGLPFPDGYDSWILALLGLSGVTTIGMIGKRATDRELAKIKNQNPTPAPSVVVQDAQVVKTTGNGAPGSDTSIEGG